ncbi:MAG: hypothetical protein AAF738_05925, partial [Bacteroidota bacterium]
MKTNIHTPIGLLLAFLLVATACKKQNAPTEISENLSTYITAYTSGVISKTAPVYVHFAQAAISEEQIGQSADQLLTLLPKATGRTIWEDTRTLRFEADMNLEAHQSYTATLSLKPLFEGLPKDMEAFTFKFETRQQYLNVYHTQVQATDEQDLSQQQITGI